MPRFEVVPLDEARVKSATGKRAQALQEYLDYIAQLKEGDAGKLQVAQGETPTAVRRRLGAAAKAADKNVVIKRVGEELYFWLETKRRGRGGRGRRKKVATGTA